MRPLPTRAALVALTLALAACDDAVTDPVQEPAAGWDLMFFALAGNSLFAEAMVLPPDAGGFPERIFPVGRFARDPTPSPDGTRIAYIDLDEFGSTHLTVADRDGGNARRIGTESGIDEWPAWSPDGTRIAFQSSGEGADDIYVVNADGSGLQQLTFDPLPAVTAEREPAWAPDGSVIAYSSTLNGSYDIFTIRPDGSDMRQITSTLDAELEPSWAPGGDRLVVRRVTLENEWDLSIIGLDGAELQRIALPGFQRAPSWRADGKVIAFNGRTRSDAPWQVFTIPAAGGQPVQQTPDSFTGGQRPVWLRRR